MTRTGTAVAVAVSAPLGAVLSIVALSLVAWVNYQHERHRRRHTPWNLQ